MNKGIKLATGDILYFLNTNDYIFDKNVLSDVVEFFQHNKTDIVFGDMSFIEDDAVEKERRIYSDVDKLFFINECVCHQGIFYKKHVFDKCGLYNLNYRLTADYELNLKALMNKKLKFKYFNRVIAKFTLGGQSNCQNDERLLTLQKKEKDELLNKYFKPYHFKMNKILNKTFRSIARNPKARSIVSKIFNFAI